MAENGDRSKRPKTEETDGTSTEATMSENGGWDKRPKTEETDGTAATDQSNDQSCTERRVLRSRYLTLQSHIRERRDAIAADSSEKFISFIGEVDGMHHNVRKPREQVSDAEALNDLTNALVTSIRVHSTGSVTPSLFVSSLITKFGKNRGIGNTESAQVIWKDIGLHASSVFQTFQGSCSMVGPMRHNLKPPEVSITRKRRKSSVKEEKVKPEELDETISKEKRETEKIIATMFDILKIHENVCLENIILNRISFAQTVENLFALSFLVKDGRVVITVDDNGSHHVAPRNAPSPDMISTGKVAYSHFIFRFDFIDWKLMKDLVGEGCELMPHRTNSESIIKDEVGSKRKPTCVVSRIEDKVGSKRKPTCVVSRIEDKVGSKRKPICVESRIEDKVGSKRRPICVESVIEDEVGSKRRPICL